MIERINSEVVKIVSAPKLKAEWASRGEETIAMPPGKFTKFVTDESTSGEDS